ncbi:MAG TPA: ATP-binding cassette domain-containing protein, partial [Castellaniella sp.]|nr:ATP-binding cassette domain-containing protein [Castellaniella sp.]
MNRLDAKVWIAILMVVIAAAPLAAGNFTVSLLNEIGISALVALGLVLLTGVGGAISFGQAAFVGIAAYATAWLTTVQGLSPWLGLLFALLLTGVSALVIGMLTLRLGGHFLALSTIAWGLSIAMLFGNMASLGRHTGLSNIPALQVGSWSLADPHLMYYLIWVVVGLSCLFSYNLLNSRPGRAIRGLRGGATLLASVGADAYRTRLSLFVVSALMAGLAGWLYAHMNRFVSPSPFDVHASIEYLLMAVAGGLGSLAGALLGAGLVLALKNALQDVLPMLTQNAGQLDSITFAALFILLLHFARSGLMGFVLRWRVRSAKGRKAVQPPLDPSVARLPHRPKPEKGTQILSVQGVVKRFGGLVAVDNVSFDMRAGEIVGLIGPNGAGKSTMFNLLTRTLPMTSGQVTFLGQDISGLRQIEVARMGLARTFQHVKLRPYMSLLDNVALGAHARATSGVLRAGFRLNRTEERQVLQEARYQL